MASANSIKMGQGHVTLGVDRGPLDAGLEAAKSSFQAWGKGIAALGAAIAAGGASVAAPFLAGLGDFIAWGGEMRGVMRETSMSFSEAQNAMNGLRVSGDELPTLVAKMSEFMVSAREGSVSANQSLTNMGLSLAALNGMTDGQRLEAFADGLNRIGDSARRIHTVREVFGRNGLGANISGGSAGMQERAARMRELQGDSRSEEAQRAAGAVGRARSEMGMATGAIMQSLAYAAAPIMEEFFRLVTNIAIAVRQWADANRPLLTMIFYFADKLILVGSLVGFLGSAIYAASYAFAFFQGAIAIAGGALSWVGGLIVGGFNVALGAMSLMLGVVKSGFGLLTLATFAWSVGSTTAIAIGTAAVWAYNTATAAVSFMLGLFTGASGAATAGTTAYTISLIAAWIWENLVTAGIWLFITALGALVIAIGAVVLSLAGFAIFGVAAWFLYDKLPQIIVYFEQLIDAVGETSAWNAFATVINQVAGVAMQAFRAIRDAVSVGDMSLAWDIFSTAALLAFEHVSYYAIGVFNQLSDWVSDTFTSVWNTIRMAAITMWGEVMAYSLNGLAILTRQLAAVTPAGAYRDLLNARAEGLAIDARITREGATREVAGIAERELFDAGNEVIWREMRDTVRAVQNGGNAAALQAQLDDLQMYAEFLQAAAGGGAAVPGIGRRPGGGDDAGKTSSAGTFSRYAAAGFMGAFGFDSETRQEREARLAREHLAELVRIANRQRGVVMR